MTLLTFFSMFNQFYAMFYKPSKNPHQDYTYLSTLHWRAHKRNYSCSYKLRYKNLFLQNSNFLLGGKVPSEKYGGPRPMPPRPFHHLWPYVVRLSASYIFFHIKASKVGVLPWIWWLLTLTRHSRLCWPLHPKLQATDYLATFGHYLVQHYFASLDGKCFLATLRKSYRQSQICMFPL